MFAAITADANILGDFFDAFHSDDKPSCPLLTKVDLSGNSVSNPQASFKLSQVFAKQCWPILQHLNLSSAVLKLCIAEQHPRVAPNSLVTDRCCVADMGIGESGFQMLADAIRAGPASSISYLDVSGNAVGRAMHSFSRCLLSGALKRLRFLALMGACSAYTSAALWCQHQ